MYSLLDDDIIVYITVEDKLAEFMVQVEETMANKKKTSKSKPHKSSYNNSRSVVGSIYTYKKHKKPKRVGKTCIHFDKDKLTCRLSKTLCKDADDCTSYVANLQEVQLSQVKSHKQSSGKKKGNINEVGITAIVLSDNRKCTNNKHTIVDLNAILRIAQPNGKVITYTVPAAYCESCDTYFVLKRDYKIAKTHGTILCPIIDMTAQSNSSKATGNLATSESRIHQLGYNVKHGNGYTKEQRQLILANILENTNISRHEIESCILRPMMQHKNQINYSDAVMAWQQDLEFIKNYKLGDIPEVIIEKIVIGQRV